MLLRRDRAVGGLWLIAGPCVGYGGHCVHVQAAHATAEVANTKTRAQSGPSPPRALHSICIMMQFASESWHAVAVRCRVGPGHFHSPCSEKCHVAENSLVAWYETGSENPGCRGIRASSVTVEILNECVHARKV